MKLLHSFLTICLVFSLSVGEDGTPNSVSQGFLDTNSTIKEVEDPKLDQKTRNVDSISGEAKKNALTRNNITDNSTTESGDVVSKQNETELYKDKLDSLYQFIKTSAPLVFSGDWRIGADDSPSRISPKFTENHGMVDSEILIFAMKNDTRFKLFTFTTDLRNGRYKDERTRTIFSIGPKIGSFEYDEEKHKLTFFMANLTFFPVHYIT